MTKRSFETTIFTLSHSSMSLLEKCPREWYLRYIAGHYLSIPQPWNDFGVLIHEVSERYNGEGKQKLIELAKSIIHENGYNIPPTYLKKVPLALKNFKKFYDIYLSKSTSIKREKEFRTDLNPYIDLVRLVDILYRNSAGEWVVVDLKTSKNKGEHSIQLSLYYFLMTLITGQKPKSIKAQIVYLSLESESTDIEDIVEDYVLDHDDLEAIEGRIHNSMNVITNCGDEKKKWRKKPSALCNYCAYKEYGLCNPDV